MPRRDTIVERHVDLDELLGHRRRPRVLTDAPPATAEDLGVWQRGDERIGGSFDPGLVADLLEVNAAIEAVLTRLDIVAGAVGRFERVGDGWVQHYENCDIYVGPVGAFWVAGHLRAKYTVLGGAVGLLGFPTTDSLRTPDGRGWFNHFEAGSIYWTPQTGPMMVRGVLRDRWADLGWERSWLGYPVADSYRLPGLTPADHPKVAWSVFENGAITETALAAGPALVAEIGPDDVRRLLRERIDAQARSTPKGLAIGFHPQTDALGTTGWSHGFYRSVPREIGVRLYGWHDNWRLPDTEFTVELRLRFGLVWLPQPTFATTKTLVTRLTSIRVRASGLFPEDVAEGVQDGIWDAFHRGGPDPARPEVADGSVFVASVPTVVDQTGDGQIFVVDVLTTAAGGLQFLVPTGPIVDGGSWDGRRVLVQQQVDQLLGR